MKALFAHGLKFFEDKNGKLYLRGYDKNDWERYLKHFDELYIIGRRLHIKEESLGGFNEFKGNNLHFIEVPEIHSLLDYKRNIKDSNQIIKNLTEFVDFTIARIPGTYSSNAIKYSKRYKKPYIVEMVGCPWDAFWNHSLKGKLIAPYITINTKRIVKNAPYVIYVTNDFLQRRYPTKGKKTNCSNVTLPNIDEAVLKERLRKICDTKENQKKIIGTTAAVDVRYKGQQYVIKALGELKRQGITNFEYQLVGGGDQAFLKSIAIQYNVLDQIKFKGPMLHKEVFEWLDKIDLYIQPSRQEGLPRALIEAMSRGLPALGAKTAGIPELLEKNYLFSNTNRNIREICTILTTFSNEKMKVQEKRNFIKSKEYDNHIINKRREQFFKKIVLNTII